MSYYSEEKQQPSGGGYVLAMYDIRGKQEYIYRSSKIKEIVGASAVIRDCFRDYLYPAAIAYREGKNNLSGIDLKKEAPAIFNYKEAGAGEDGTFDRNAFGRRMEGNQYLGEVVYDGGGNFFVLYKDRETCCGINRIFTRALQEYTYSLRAVCCFVEKVNFDDYPADQSRLYDEHERCERNMVSAIPAQVMPLTR